MSIVLEKMKLNERRKHKDQMRLNKRYEMRKKYEIWSNKMRWDKRDMKVWHVDWARFEKIKRN